MANFTISAEARITLCPDGYECCGQRQASNGTVDFVESPQARVIPTSPGWCAGLEIPIVRAGRPE